jgi:hypothetical protein
LLRTGRMGCGPFCAGWSLVDGCEAGVGEMKARGRVSSSDQVDVGPDRVPDPGGYQSPTVVRLGTLAELTLAVGVGLDDGLGGQDGDGGSG